ncbi:endonuclease/exonuclease/phosphatase family protein [Streptomyces sp. SAI-229]|jgi:endonuclease/exonuclease/phosphatase family metal-dependent hydrolase|uniref:endonuclease/exonuclease/phosphatase family protein n=1 Tax=Streptomyces sp. SAI-229 TaxID=3377731 RepID=UPI003C7B156F
MFPAPPLTAGRGRLRALLAAASAVSLSALLVMVSPAPDAPGTARPEDRTLTVATWNTCGVRRWGCAGTGSEAAKGRAVRRLVDAGAGVLLLQETCVRSAESMREALGRSWNLSFLPYTWRDVNGRVLTVRCDGAGSGPAGLAILSSHPLSAVREVSSPQPVVGLRRGILCATVAAHGVRICNAHLSTPGSDRAEPDREYRDGQLRALVAAVPARNTVFGGDLNLRPPTADGSSVRLWPFTAYRTHRECDQTSATGRSGRATHESGHKLDYLFTGLRSKRCAVYDTGVSDHRALLIQVDMRADADTG